MWKALEPKDPYILTNFYGRSNVPVLVRKSNEAYFAGHVFLRTLLAPPGTHETFHCWDGIVVTLGNDVLREALVYSSIYQGSIFYILITLWYDLV